MDSLTELHPIIQLTIRYLSDPNLSLQTLGQEQGISKQAVHKQVQRGLEFLKTFEGTTTHKPAIKSVPVELFEETKQKLDIVTDLVQQLRCQLVLRAVQIQLLNFFKERVLKFFSKFRPGRLPAREKQKILDHLDKFKKIGGLIKDFAKVAGVSAETLHRWQEAYAKHGLAGLEIKSTRPKGFGHKISAFIKEQLILLFLRYPHWSNYQYHSYIRNNPTTHWYVSIPTIQKLKAMHQYRSQEEKDRLKKRWCFAPGTDVWTIDFTCIFKTDNYKLQLLTISDHRSRFLIHTSLCLSTSTALIIDHLEELFIKHGKPKIIKADNGPEFRLDCKNSLIAMSVYLMNSPVYYGQFNGAHERIHRAMKACITPFERHQNLTQLVEELKAFENDYNYVIPMDYLNGKTPSEIYLNNQAFVPGGIDQVTPYEKDGELRMKFPDRNGNPARISMPLISP